MRLIYMVILTRLWGSSTWLYSTVILTLWASFTSIIVFSPARSMRRGGDFFLAPGFCPGVQRRFTFSCELKNSKNIFHFFWNFNVTFLATWRCSSDFFAAKIQNGRQPKKKTSKKNFQNLKSEITQILLLYSPRYGDVQATFSMFYWNSKWPPRINFFCGRKNKKNGNFLKFQHHIPSNMGMCRWFFKVFTELQNGRLWWTPYFFVSAKTLTWYRTSGLLLTLEVLLRPTNSRRWKFIVFV